MRNKLLHQFWAKALGVPLFIVCTVLSLLCVATFAFNASGSEYYLEHNFAGPFAGLLDFSLRLQGTLLWAGAVCGIVAVALFLFLMCAAGRHSDSEQPRPSRFDRLPFDLLLVLTVVFLLLCARTAGFIDSYNAVLVVLFIAVALIGSVLLCITLAMTFAARVKTNTFWRSNMIAYVLRFAWKVARWLGRWIKALFGMLPVLWKVITAYLLFGLLCIVFFAGVVTESGGGFVFLFFLTALGMLGLLCVLALQMQRIKKGGEALAQGRLDERIDTQKLWFDIKTHAENLNSVALGMSRAVEARMKSERMKTDLITNVSHDLKTPLTSIVNYVELLKKEELGNERAVQYVEVLDRQAHKLKKLTEDIIEASKASSGALSVNLAPTDVREILHQSLAEYGEKLSAANLAAVVRVSEPLPPVMADGRLLWRVLDNLLSNACKYSLAGSRVYCEAAQKENATVISIKNVSMEAIADPIEELTERFVRGDDARASEGSGLGLSIARSLMELQKGALCLSADGDLFKAEVIFPPVQRFET